MDLSDILVALIGGVIIGLLGKFVAPGDRDNIPLWLTIVCGIGGVLLGTFLYSMFFDPTTSGIDWWRHIWQIVVAAVLVMIASAVTGRSSSKV
ncbi:GlsB/YeaQ/YmgE family stress response membrane protein [Nocardioides seonyuensis]|uniref:GlsB/YeaQ/YmgE family stress response membrane protein n=1 Tax=Nocardioides seonyuensis TaxID=2518371 RepID=A0A4P7IJB7_9ACTN|nr:GlsB/YeaQ/YmgE family stress response membrane protein [Nocardioides seonyuensis]QBX56377.1 GlsB/YeaQ/YmgE family stress response membrane protein [Nocardioides seonyuensis]